MSNAAALQITARAASIASHDEWLAFMNDDENITAFAHDRIGVVELDREDYCDMEYLASEVQHLLRLEVMTDAELITEYVDNERAHANIREQDGMDYDHTDYYGHLNRQDEIGALLEWRRIQRQYCSAMALTHNPFLALLAA